MGALHNAILNGTAEERHTLVRDAIIALGANAVGRSITRDGFTITLLTAPMVGMNGLLQFSCRITRVSDGAVVTPPDLNPVYVRFPPYLVADPTGDVVINGTTFKEDLGAVIESIIGPLIDKVT
jgi:hypothetical protein